MLRRLLQINSFFLLVFLLYGTNGCDRVKEKEWLFSSPSLGTRYTIKVFPASAKITKASLQTGIDRVLETVTHQMSTYDAESELSRFNQHQSTAWFEVSADTMLVIKDALMVSQLSQGAFDVTVGALVNLWGFGPGQEHEQIPSDERIRSLLEVIGYQNLEVQNLSIRKKKPSLYVDLSAIAKGFAVDKVSAYIESQGIDSYMVEIGGEIRTKGKKIDGQFWRIAIESPVAEQRKIQKVISLENLSVATSGDYRNYFEKEGRRYSHTIDPTTGKPITHSLASVSVIDVQCMHADALATAFMVLGQEKAYELAVRENIALFMIIRDGDQFVEKSTPAFEKLNPPSL
ncbi:FAD:protein FMN transferase [Deltaproteobacteria bacterium TL4]